MSDFGFDGLNKLSADLTELAGIITGEARKSVQQTAIKTKKSWADDAAKSMGSVGARYAPTIDYTEHEYGGFGQGVLEAEIGPNLARYGGKTGEGGLVPSMGILEEANGGVRGRPSHAVRRAEKFAGEEFVKRLELAIDESAKRVNL